MDESAFKSLLAELLRTHPEGAHAGRIHLISLEEVAAAFGGEWRRLADKALTIAESVITSKLARTDAWLRVGDDSFLLLLGGLSLPEAELKVLAVSREIRRRLLGEKADRVQGFQVAHRVVPVGDLDLNSGDITAVIHAVDHPKARVNSLTRIALQMDFEYHPVRVLSDPAAALWLMRPRRRVGEMVLADSDIFAAGRGDPLAAVVDARIAELIDESHFDAPIIAPIYITPALAGTQNDLLGHHDLEACRLGHAIDYELVGIADDLGRPLLRDLARALAPCARTLLARTPPDTPLLRFIEELGVSHLGLSLSHARRAGFSEKDVRRLVRAFARDAKAAGFQSYLWDVDRADDVAFAKESGFSLICGPAVGVPHATPSVRGGGSHG